MESKWISVEDKLPSNRQEILAVLNYVGAPKICQCVFVERYCTESVDWNNVFVGLDKGFYVHQGVTHWMPLPEPPKN